MGASDVTVVCVSCGTPNPPGFRFCGECGGPLELRCPSCGAGVPAGFRFCGNCGEALSTGPSDDAPTSASSGERKIVSVVFADLEASTELATRLDPEDLRDVYRPYFDAMAEQIVQHGGTVEKFIGDAVVGVFGAPTALGDDPARAVRAALAMQAQLPDLNRRLAVKIGGELVLRVAVHTGEVVSTPGAEREGLVTGDATTIASRLQGSAPPGRVVVGERTYRVTRREFRFEPLGELRLKGVATPVAGWVVLGEGGTDASPFASPLIGRTDELELLRLLLRRCARERRPSVVTVVGAAGIGKSRLGHEFADGAGRDGSARVVRGRCVPYGDGLHLWPLAQVLKQDAGILDSDPSDAIVVKAGGSIGARFDEGDAAAPIVSTLLSSIGIQVASDPLSGAGREAAERMITDAWSRYLAGLAGDAPLIVVIEDIHWADPSLLHLLDRLASRTPAAVLFLCLARPEVFERSPDWGSGRSNFATIELTPLSSDEETTLVENLLDHETSPELVSAIVARAEGNPFFASELLRMLAEDGTIERRDGAWTIAGAIPSDLPDTVQGAIAARIDRLAPIEKRAIQDAAVVGRVFWEGALEALGTLEIEPAVDGLIARGLIRVRPESSIADARELTFDHALIRDVAYGSIPRARRSEAHAAVLGWIDRMTRGRDEEFAELIAHHATQAGDLERTVRSAMLAGHRHRRVYAAEEAIAWYGRALEAAQELPPDGATMLVAEIAYSRGEALEQLSRFEEAQADYERALSAAPPGTGRESWEAQILASLTHVLWMRDRYEEGEALLPRAREAARLAGAAHIEARVLYTAGAIAWAQGGWTSALASHEEALRVAEEAGDLEGEAYARHGITDTRSFLGPLEEALDQGTRAQGLWRRLGQRPMQLHNDQMVGWIQVYLGRFREALDTIAEAVAGHRELGQRRDEVTTLAARAQAELGLGELGAAVATANEAVELGATVAAPRPQYLSVFTRLVVLAELGADALARQHFPAATDLSDRLGVFYRPPLISARGWLELVSGDRASAMSSFSEGRRQAEGGVFHELLCGRFEIRAWETVADADGLADAGAWLLKAAEHESPPYAALGAWALARADRLSGRADGGQAGAALELAEQGGDRNVLWRACALAGAVAEEPGEATPLLRRASEIVGGIVATLPEGELKDAYVARPEVAELLSRRS